MKKLMIAAALLLGLTGIGFAQTSVAKNTSTTKHPAKMAIAQKSNAATTTSKVSPATTASKVTPATTASSNKAGSNTGNAIGKHKHKAAKGKVKTAHKKSPAKKEGSSENSGSDMKKQ